MNARRFFAGLPLFLIACMLILFLVPTLEYYGTTSGLKLNFSFNMYQLFLGLKGEMYIAGYKIACSPKPMGDTVYGLACYIPIICALLYCLFSSRKRFTAPFLASVIATIAAFAAPIIFFFNMDFITSTKVYIANFDSFRANWNFPLLVAGSAVIPCVVAFLCLISTLINMVLIIRSNTADDKYSSAEYSSGKFGGVVAALVTFIILVTAGLSYGAAAFSGKLIDPVRPMIDIPGLDNGNNGHYDDGDDGWIDDDFNDGYDEEYYDTKIINGSYQPSDGSFKWSWSDDVGLTDFTAVDVRARVNLDFVRIKVAALDKNKNPLAYAEDEVSNLVAGNTYTLKYSSWDFFVEIFSIKYYRVIKIEYRITR